MLDSRLFAAVRLNARHRAAECYSWIGAETTSPEAFAEDDDGRSRGVRWQERPARNRRHAEDVEVLRRHRLRADLLSDAIGPISAALSKRNAAMASNDRFCSVQSL